MLDHSERKLEKIIRFGEQSSLVTISSQLHPPVGSREP
jgi:hypothetical protein